MDKTDKLMDKILASDMTLMEKAISNEFIFRNEELIEEGKSSLKLDFEKIKYLNDKFMNSDYIWEEINFFINNELEDLEIAEEENDYPFDNDKNDEEEI